MARTTAREMVMQLLFEKSIGGDGGAVSQEMILDQINETKKRPDKLTKADEIYIARVMEGLTDHRDSVDKWIGETAVDWEIDRIGKVDLAVLRLAIYELLYERDTPASVVINEAVNLGKRYSQPVSGKFINGILASVLKKTEADQKSKKEQPEEEQL